MLLWAPRCVQAFLLRSCRASDRTVVCSLGRVGMCSLWVRSPPRVTFFFFRSGIAHFPRLPHINAPVCFSVQSRKIPQQVARSAGTAEARISQLRWNCCARPRLLLGCHRETSDWTGAFLAQLLETKRGSILGDDRSKHIVVCFSSELQVLASAFTSFSTVSCVALTHVSRLKSESRSAVGRWGRNRPGCLER